MRIPLLSRATCIFLLVSTLILSACGGGGGNSTPEKVIPTEHSLPTPTLAPTLIQAPDNAVAISGTLTFDLVPHTASGALNYSETKKVPIKSATVELLDEKGNQVGTGQTQADEQGNYLMYAPLNTAVRVRVRAESDSNQWRFKVVNNTKEDSVYVMDGGLVNSGTTDSVRDLHAASGWGGAGYTSTRVAAPFAILDAVNQAMQFVADVDAAVSVPELTLAWSSENKTTSTINLEGGEIRTTHYSSVERKIYVLGEENTDTDEYDRAVIQHEFAHFLEDVLWRSDNIGGSHTFFGMSDMRVAFSEGFANAFAVMVSGGQVLTDSSGRLQGNGLSLSLESDGFSTKGWYNETSIGRIIYDLYDSIDDGADTISLGFSAIYDALSSNGYKNSSALTSIYLFIDEIRSALDDEQKGVLDSLLKEQNINSSSAFGEGEINDGGVSESLPIYHVMAPSQGASVCSDNNGGEAENNGLGVNSFIRFSMNSSNEVAFDVSYASGLVNSDPDFIIHKQGDRNYPKAIKDGGTNYASNTSSYSAGDYVMEVYSYYNRDSKDSTGGKACYKVEMK